MEVGLKSLAFFILWRHCCKLSHENDIIAHTHCSALGSLPAILTHDPLFLWRVRWPPARVRQAFQGWVGLRFDFFSIISVLIFLSEKERTIHFFFTICVQLNFVIGIPYFT
jgi:hypothetical protein